MTNSSKLLAHKKLWEAAQKFLEYDHISTRWTSTMVTTEGEFQIMQKERTEIIGCVAFNSSEEFAEVVSMWMMFFSLYFGDIAVENSIHQEKDINDLYLEIDKFIEV